MFDDPKHAPFAEIDAAEADLLAEWLQVEQENREEDTLRQESLDQQENEFASCTAYPYREIGWGVRSVHLVMSRMLGGVG